jgi:glycosyltransferase involved in cell wall biosynthesis
MRRLFRPGYGTRGAIISDRPRRIALFTGNYNHIADGVSLTLNRLVAHLQSCGHRVIVFGPTVDEPPMEHNGRFVPVPSISAPGRPEYRIALGFPHRLRTMLAQFDPDLVHIATPDILGKQAQKWALRRGIPVVSSYHTHFSSYLRYYGLEIMEGFLWQHLRRFYKRCRHIYVPSLSVEAVLHSHGITKGLRLWERGVNMERFNPQRRSTTWRARYGIEPDEVVVTFVGRLVWEKGLHIYADVIEGLNKRGIPHRSIVVGSGPAEAELQARLIGTVFTGHLDGLTLAQAYASSDVFVFPSETETFGNVTLEALASGLPAVCARATGSMELVEHGHSGFLLPPDDSEAFLDATARLVQDVRLRKDMGRAALAQAQHYSWPAVLDRIVGYYDELLAPNEPARPIRRFSTGDGHGDGATVPVPSISGADE